MLSRRLLLASIVTMLASVACGNASFFGGGGKKKQNAPVGTTPPGTETPKTPGTGTPGTGTPGTGTPGTGTPGTGTPGTGTPGTGTQNCPNSPCQDPQIGPNDQVTQPNPNTIIFGRDKVFHIGDGRYDNTSCKEQVAALPLLGTAYFFRFEVLNDNTIVTVNVAQLCGLDYATNTYQLYSGGSRVQGSYIGRQQAGVSGVPVTLRKGIYSVVLTSGWGRDAGESQDDRDDYIVGHVTVQGNQPVNPPAQGQYGAYQLRN